MNRCRLNLVLIAVVWVGLGCNLASKLLETATSVPTELPPPVEEVFPPTATNTIEPEINPTPTEEPLPTPVVEDPTVYPVGFTASSGNNDTVTFYDLSGQELGTVQTPGMSSDKMHVAGHFMGDPGNIPVLFHTYENNGDIKQTLNGQVTTHVSGPDVAYMQGAPGQNAIVYETVTWGENISSYFYVRSAYGGGASWIWDRVDPEGWALAPMSAVAENDELHTVFYTLEPQGIGGDIVFPPRKGFFQLNLENMENILHLTEGYNPIGISPDNTVLAYTDVNKNIGSETTSRITLYNLDTTVMIPIDLVPGSDRGGGYAVFSPDNQYVAWMEASGWLMSETPNFNSRVRIANQDGSVIADIPVSDFGSVVADPTARWGIPAGWLDGENLLVEVRGDNWDAPVLVRIRYDGTNMVFLAPGQFLGFLYP